MKTEHDSHLYRGMLQSRDGVISEVIHSDHRAMTFLAHFELSRELVARLKAGPEHMMFSERSRIARLGVQMRCDPIGPDSLEERTLTLRLTAIPFISGYPGMDMLAPFFTPGFPVGRLVFCDPEALLAADAVMEAIDSARLKLPASTSISSSGDIVIAPHKVVCRLRNGMTPRLLSRILLDKDGRETLNRHQIQEKVPAIILPPKDGVITTCSMYLNEHYIMLKSGSELGRQFAATVLDPIKTRGVRIYLEIANETDQPIVNPLISARIYSAKKSGTHVVPRPSSPLKSAFGFEELKAFEAKLDQAKSPNCHFAHRPVAVLPRDAADFSHATIYTNGPPGPCQVKPSACTSAARDFSFKSVCPHVYGTSKVKIAPGGEKQVLVTRYFPNLLEHRDILNLASEGGIKALYFYEASRGQGPFLSQMDHDHLEEYHAFGLKVYWVCPLNNRLMVHTMREDMGYFVAPDRLADFHKSMLFAFYGSNKELSDKGAKRLGDLLDALIAFWGQRIGIVTGGGSGVMERANTLARSRGILSGANFLDITDQSMTTDVDFCQVFQAKCRHSRQKWFEIASFPIFNVGGIGTLEEIGITLCNMKLSILEPGPIVFFDTEGTGTYWNPLKEQILTMIRHKRAPGWFSQNIVITDDPEKVIQAYRERLQLF